MQEEKSAPITPTPEITLSLSLAEVDLVLAALAKLPLETSANAFFKIRAQGAAQAQTTGETK